MKIKTLLFSILLSISLISCGDNEDASKQITKEEAEQIYNSYSITNALKEYCNGTYTYENHNHAVYGSIGTCVTDSGREGIVIKSGYWEMMDPNSILKYGPYNTNLLDRYVGVERFESFNNFIYTIDEFKFDKREFLPNEITKLFVNTEKYELNENNLVITLTHEAEMLIYNDVDMGSDDDEFECLGNGKVKFDTSIEINEVGLPLKYSLEFSFYINDAWYSYKHFSSYEWNNNGYVSDNTNGYFTDNRVSLFDNMAYNLVYDQQKRFEDVDKYFLVFVSSNCQNCKDAEKAFITLFNDSTFKGDYKIKTIYTDEEGEDVDIHEEGKFFELFFSNKENVIDFHEAIYTAAYNSDYYDQVASETYEDHLDDIRTGEDLWTPLILLMDKETYEGDNSTFGVKEAMIGLKGWDGDDNYDKAETLDRMWNSNWEN